MIISIENPQKKFTEHLNQPSNSRVFFSGKFGTGKSYFLKEYFKNRKNDHNLFWLSPINYVVGANEDIFEWIKIDLAKELLSKYLITKDEEKFAKNLLIQTYLYQNGISIFGKLITILSNDVIKKVAGLDILKALQKEIKDYEKFEQQSQNKIPKLEEFLSNSTQAKGSIYEDDLTTKIIRASIEKVKFDTNKENILVIDDLDRLDPEHIFRILNILSAHHNHFDANKFGFDRVILVCDYENIHALYKYRYGSEADFEGYIEKFFTYEPFYFSINDSIVQYCQNKIEIGTKEEDKNTLSILLEIFYRNGLLKIRNLKKVISEYDKLSNSVTFEKKAYNPPYFFHNVAHYQIQKIFTTKRSFEIDYNQISFLRILFILSLAFGGVQKMLSVLVNFNARKTDDLFDKKYFNDIMLSMGLITHLSNHNLNTAFSAFYNWHDMSGGAHIYEQTYPTINFFNLTGKLLLKWSYNQEYNDGNYFLDVSFGQLLGKSTNETQHLYSCSQLIKEIINCTHFVIAEKIFSNIKEN